MVLVGTEGTKISFFLTSMNGIFSRHEGGAGRCADGRDVVLVQRPARERHRVDVGSRDLVRAVEPHIVPTLMIKTRSSANDTALAWC